jgi:hypothetical protein
MNKEITYRQTMLYADDKKQRLQEIIKVRHILKNAVQEL